MTYRLKINSYATEDVEAKSAIYALAEYADTRIPPAQQVLIRAQGDEATLTYGDYTIEARPLEWREMSCEEKRMRNTELAAVVASGLNAVEASR